MNTKIVFAKILSFLTIFAMVTTMMTGFAASVRAQEVDDTEPAQEVVETPTVDDTEESDSDTETPEEKVVEETAPISALRVSDDEDKKVEICHQGNVISVSENAQDTHLNSEVPGHEGDFLIENPDDLAECEGSPTEEIVIPTTATISATKILCPSEDLLPNWGNYGDDITSTTAAEFLNAEGNESCEEVDWNFEWSIGAPYVDDNILTGGEGWTSFENGTTVVPAGQNIGLREQMLPGYTTFTGQNVDQNESAEFYCESDVLNYDNLEYVNTVAGGTYHCVAFNAHPDLCSNVEGIQTEVPKGMETDGDYCYTPETEEGICEEGDETYESVYVSDPTTLVGENPSAVLSFIHDAWTAVIGDANWIWSTNPVALVPSVDEVETFTKTFEVTGTPTSASLTIAADNSYSVTLNGDALCASADENNFGATDNCPINVLDLDNGTNTLEFTVTNKETADNLNPQTNPAGLMYKLEINGDCEVCEMQEGWDVDYYNYTQYDTGMNLPVQDWYKKSTYGNPLSADNTFSTNTDAWTGWSYGNDKYEFSQVESDLMFGANNFFPFDSGTGLPYSNESLVFTGVGVNNVYTYVEGPSGTDYHFGLHATGYVDAPAAGNYAFTLTSDDDVWVYVDGVLVVDNSGVHGVPGTVTDGDIYLDEGVNKVELFYAERHGKQAALNFEFTNKDLVIMTTEDCLPPPPVDMCPNIEGTQETVPEGMVKNNDGQCVTPEEPLVCNPGVNLVQNGGFESPVLDSGTWGLFEEGDLLGWLIDWIYDSEGTPTLEIQNNVAGAPYEGNQHAELDGNHPVGMYQVIETIPGETYDFSYSYSARPGRDAEDNRIWVRIDNNADATVYSADHAIDATYTPGTVWTTYSTSFVADSETTIMFNDMGTDTSFGGYIDGVSLTCDPEPEVDMCEWNNDIPADSDDCVPPPPLDMCPNVEGIQTSYEECMIQVIDLCLNLPGTQTEVPNGFENVGEGMCYSQYECSDGIDNSDSEDELADANDPACHTDGDATDEDEVNSYDPYDMSEENTTDGGDEEPTPNRSTSGSRSNRSGGSVLGASTDGVCAFDIDTYMRKGYKNDTAQVKVMQMLMNKYAGSTLSIDGLFGAMTEKAVKAFQSKYADEVLTGAWVGLKAPTGIFFRSTLAKAKNLECPEVVTPIPVGLTNEHNWNKAKNEIVPAQ